MSDFLWSSGHLGWGVFALAVFTALWWLLGDLYWRLANIRIAWFVATMAGGWVIGAGLIALTVHLVKLQP